MAKSKVAMMTKVKTFEIQEYDIPAVGDDEMLIRVEGCGVCGTDVHEYKDDPFGCLPIILGHEGTGEIVKLGKNIKSDTVGNLISVGDKIVTSIIPCGQCEPCMTSPEKTELCEGMGCYGLTPDDELHLNGWFAEYLFIRKGSTFFKVNEFDVNTRIMIEPLAVGVHAVERAKSTGLITFNTFCVINGAGPIGISVLTVLKTMGIQNVIMIDGNDSRLALAKKIGASVTLNFKHFASNQDLIKEVIRITKVGAGFVFQTTGNATGFSNALKFVKRGGGVCEVGYFVELGEVNINPHTDICHKEITLVGSYAYTPQTYPITIDMIRRALEIGIPISDMVTHWYPLEEISQAFDKNMSMEGLKIAVGPKTL
ncbi:MAG: theronine dehydrogenase [Candidatus Epulonipiscioides saccharophilum]|nr:MAG: theronine dehydrogenase [Epulopiscium sp. AS2M-Bin001]